MTSPQVSLDELRDTVRRVATGEIPKYQDEQYYNTVPRDLFSTLAGVGLCGLTIEEEFGGLGLGSEAASIAIEELASVDLGPAIFLSVHLMVAGLVRAHGSKEQRATVLPKLASGEWLGAFALTEPAAGSDAVNLRTEWKREGDFYRITGEKCYITSAGWADLYIVFASKSPGNGPQHIAAFLVETAPALASGALKISKPERKMGCELSPIASLRFDGLKIPKTQLLGSEESGYTVARTGLFGGRINIAAAANGVAASAISSALSHLKEREQFGQALIEFQGLQFMLAEMKMKLEAARAVTEKAARTLDKEPKGAENRLLSSIAKCVATDAAMSITTDAVQLLGGAGYIREYKVERLMRDAKMLQIVEGTNQIQRSIIAKELKRS